MKRECLFCFSALDLNPLYVGHMEPSDPKDELKIEVKFKPLGFVCKLCEENTTRG